VAEKTLRTIALNFFFAIRLIRQEVSTLIPQP